MATMKITTIKKSSSTFTGSNSTGVIDVIKVYGKKNTVKARSGNDQITVYEGTGHKIYGDAGVDTIVVKKGSSHRIYGGTGNDRITISVGSTNLFYGEVGADIFTIASTVGTENKVYGGAGVDTFTIKGGNSNYYYGGDAGDKYTLSGGKNNTLSGQAGNDIFTITSTVGTGNKLYGGAGVDTFNIKGGSSNNYYGGDSGDKFTIASTVGTGNKVYGGVGADTFTIKGGNSNYYYGGDAEDKYTLSGGKNNILSGQAGNDTFTITSTVGTGNKVYGGAGDDTITVSGGVNVTVNGDSGVDTIRINGGSGNVIQSGAGNDKVYINGGRFKSIANSGGNDYIEIGKNTVNGIKVDWGNGGNYKLVAHETVKVLGGNNHDIRLYGGNDKVIVAGGSGHVLYTDGPTGSGDGGGNDTIVIQNSGTVKKIVAGNGNDVIAIANGAGNGSTIYTGLENPNNVNTGTGVNTVNILGGSGHTLYLGGTENKVLIEAQNVTLNKYAGTADDIRVRWSEQGTGTLRINCPSVSSSKESTLRIEGAKSWQFEFYNKSVDIKNANGVVSETVDALVMKFVGQYNRDTRSISGNYQWNGDNEGNTRLPVYVNGNGLIQYNWCAGNQQISYNPTPVATGGSIEITRWNSDATRVFDSITFDDGSFGYSAINIATTRDTHSIALG